MAGTMRRNAIWRRFQDDPQLREYFLEEIERTETILGRGCFGTVLEVTYKGVSCAAKCIDESKIDVHGQGYDYTMSKYQKECQLMACVRHPNITQFLGLCFLERSKFPLLVMERLVMTVDDLFKFSSNVPLIVRVSILSDTCNGLVYLHSMKNPIIHRDLTVRNILLTSSLTAKIADLGNSRMVDLTMMQYMTENPGAYNYMPPEVAFTTKQEPSLDMFSFGHLSLCILTENITAILPATENSDSAPNKIRALSELERRQDYVDKLRHQFAGSKPNLVEAVTECLSNRPHERPSSRKVSEILHSLRTEMSTKYGGNLGKLLNVARILHMKKMKMKDRQKVNHSPIEVLVQKPHTELIQRVSELEKENDELKDKLQELRNQMEQYQYINIHSKSKQRKNELNWTREDMRVTCCDDIQSVEIKGIVFINGNLAPCANGFEVTAYDLKERKWYTLLPAHKTKQFTMTVIEDELVLVGGHRDHTSSNQISVWKSGKKEWAEYPPMPTPRRSPSATYCKNNTSLVVAGGFWKEYRAEVEILNVVNRQWTTAESLPTKWQGMRSATIYDTWYLMGGKCQEAGDRNVYSVSLAELVSNPSAKKLWKKLPPLNCMFSCPLKFQDSLLAVGGQHITTKKAMATIQRYDQVNEVWVEHAELQYSLYNCTTFQKSNRIYVLGGSDGDGTVKHKFMYSAFI